MELVKQLQPNTVIGRELIQTKAGPNVLIAPVTASNLPLTASFAEGLYIRELFMPKGMLFVGFHHPAPTLNMVMNGHMLCIIDGEMREIRGPVSFENAPGTKIGYAFENTTWMTIHPNPTNERDPAKLDAMIHDRANSHTKEIENQVNAFMLVLAERLASEFKALEEASCKAA